MVVLRSIEEHHPVDEHEYFTQLMRDIDLLVFGRKTYQLMVPFWPEVARNQSMTRASNEFAQTFDSINKIFSRSLDSAEDRNTRIIRTNLHCEILKLKQEQGKNILLGGVSVPSQLIALGLVDEYRFVVGPTVAGEGLAIGTQQALENQYDLVAGPDTYRIDDCLACLFEAIPVPMRWHKFFGHTFRFLEAFLHLPAGVALRDPA